MNRSPAIISNLIVGIYWSEQMAWEMESSILQWFYCTCPRTGPSGGPGAACPDLTVARITLFASIFFAAFATLEIFDISGTL